ncbi:nitroreductase family protein [Candidatus Micrarchaeota archaeon]|nr:nitroreductase family protein [Candidatus Micrarchaeota archaeon]
MEFYDVIHKRRSIRAFLGKEIESGKLERILQAANSAPSAGNLQAYRLYIVTSREIKQGICEASHGQDFLMEAPILLVFCAIRNPGMKYGDRGAELYSVQDATIAAAYCQLAITAEGLGSVWVGGFDTFEVSRLLNALPYEVPVAAIPIGYPAEQPEATGRKSLQDLVGEA